MAGHTVQCTNMKRLQASWDMLGTFVYFRVVGSSSDVVVYLCFEVCLFSLRKLYQKHAVFPFPAKEN